MGGGGGCDDGRVGVPLTFCNSSGMSEASFTSAFRKSSTDLRKMVITERNAELATIDRVWGEGRELTADEYVNIGGASELSCSSFSVFPILGNWDGIV